MAKWRIYFQVGTMTQSEEFIGTQAELLMQLNKYEFIMEVRRIYD
jgi:hypothetical protein